MKKQLLTGTAAFIMAAAMSMTSFAGQWKQDEAGWWYQNEDGSYVNNGWNWIDGKCYYFTPEGYCLTGTGTPDGYTVDETGAWVVNGVVQTQTAEAANDGISQEAAQMNTLSFAVPDGFAINSSDEDTVYYSSADGSTVIAVASKAYQEDLDETTIAACQEQLLDQELGDIDGIKGTRSEKQFPTGSWYCYDYPADVADIPGNIRAYGRIVGRELHMVMFAGATSEMDTDSIMYHNVR